MKIVFWGTPDFALPALEVLSAGPHRVAAAVTRPDRFGGRGERLLLPPVKTLAQKMGLPVLQPEKLTLPEWREKLEKLGAELMVVVAYGRFIPAAVADIFPSGAINLHPSLLPRWRGAAPIQWALIEGDRETGATVIRLSPRLDAGDILGRVTAPIRERDDHLALSSRLARLGADLLLRVVGEIEKGTVTAVPQDENLVAWAPAFEKSSGLIDWSLPADRIDRLIRGLNPWPGTYTYYPAPSGPARLKILAGRPRLEGEGGIGEILLAQDDRLVIKAGAGALEIDRLQPSGGRVLTAGEFLRGHGLRAGDILGG